MSLKLKMEINREDFMIICQGLLSEIVSFCVDVEISFDVRKCLEKIKNAIFEKEKEEKLNFDDKNVVERIFKKIIWKCVDMELGEKIKKREELSFMVSDDFGSDIEEDEKRLQTCFDECEEKIDKMHEHFKNVKCFVEEMIEKVVEDENICVDLESNKMQNSESLIDLFNLTKPDNKLNKIEMEKIILDEINGILTKTEIENENILQIEKMEEKNFEDENICEDLKFDKNESQTINELKEDLEMEMEIEIGVTDEITKDKMISAIEKDEIEETFDYIDYEDVENFQMEINEFKEEDNCIMDFQAYENILQIVPGLEEINISDVYDILNISTKIDENEKKSQTFLPNSSTIENETIDDFVQQVPVFIPKMDTQKISPLLIEMKISAEEKKTNSNIIDFENDKNMSQVVPILEKEKFISNLNVSTKQENEIKNEKTETQMKIIPETKVKIPLKKISPIFVKKAENVQLGDFQVPKLEDSNKDDINEENFYHDDDVVKKKTQSSVASNIFTQRPRSVLRLGLSRKQKIKQLHNYLSKN